MKPKMNQNDGKEDPVTELGLYLGYSTACSRIAVRNDPSAGANAGSLSFVAANPISELVWSPQGLTLKYADCSFMERQSSRFLGVGPSHMVISTSQTEKVDHANIASTKGGMVSPEGTPQSENELQGRCQLSTSENSPTNVARATKDAPDAGDSGNRDRTSNYGLHDQAETVSIPAESTWAFPGQNVGRVIEFLQNEPDPGGRNSHENSSGCSSRKQVMEVPLDTAIFPMDKASDIDGGILSRLVENDQAGNLSIPLLEKLESMDENDVREPDTQIAGGAEMKFAASESSSEVKVESMRGTRIQLDMLIPPQNHFPENSRVLENHSADKGRASSDTDADGRSLKEKNDSQESVESCNRDVMDRKRQRLDQPLFIGCKRAKQIHNQPSSSSFSGQNSSFMNWISNMMRGLPKPAIDAGTPLSFAFADPSNRPDDVACANMSENVRHTGFKTFFQKIYQPKQNAQEVGLPIAANEARIGSSSTGGINNVGTICADPMPRHEGTDDVSKHLLLSKEEINEDTSVVGSGPSSLPPGTHGHVSVFKGVSGACSGEDKFLVNNKHALVMSGSSPLEQKILKPDSTEDKAPQFGCKGDFSTLWISRFSSKVPCSSLKMDEAAQGLGGATDGCPNSSITLVQSPQSGGSEKNVVNGALNEYHNERLLGTAVKELPDRRVGTESSVGFTRAGSCHEEDHVRKVDVMLPSKCLKRSEEMASTFAQRLDALKRNILPKEIGDAKPNVLCFFCGMMGHQTRVCTEVARSDFKGLWPAINPHPHEASNMSPTCIKCFQLNHWAVSCPHKQVQDCERDRFGFWVRHGLPDAVSVHNEQTLLKNCHVKGSGNLIRKSVSASGTLTRAREDEDVSTAANQKDQAEITAGRDSVVEKTSEVPKGIFDMIKMLRLSRTDILKWRNSGASLIHLEGYFLRLRLGTCGDGLGASGYRVACVSGMMQIKRLPANGKTFISVNVGGIKCLIGSQYISNHDFLEDELKIWWYTTSTGGGTMPSEDDLQFKVEEKRRLGI